MRLLIADDNKDIRDILVAAAEASDFETVAAANGKEVLDLVKQDNISLLLLDVMMPIMDGFSVCREIRKSSDVPIIMITARGEDYDRIMGLEIGADDYVVKPFSPLEVMARVKAVLRRLPKEEMDKSKIAVGNLLLFKDNGEVQIGGKAISLTRKEYDLLYLFLSHPQRVFSRDELLDRLWGYEYTGDLRTVDTHIRRLRAKLTEAGLAGAALTTVWGRGYQWEGTE
ncbi:putative response regulator (plasmid) [Selenomonas ruminantium subsp. lactilytica TAM6421]|uniref:Putative response regulator n=1 Tax=Selenomonas ruminantium subsp. lactilytica (strain NBRC 103574 / TAM6421) TaxID=927704 RepID=I0GW22_SELRL|nr:response regulator transcription factor [Selenomonas ruminantium]BAL84959.1 putative response regulator [Selenomonas ruminantium subsp. lactilytica TAM6421]